MRWLRSVHEVMATSTRHLRRPVWIRRAWTTGAVTLSAFCTLAAFALSQDSGTVPAWNYTIGFVLNLVAAAALVWRHEHPWPVLAVALAGPLAWSTDATAALIALYALAKTDRNRPRLAAAVGAVYLACAISLTYDAHRTRDNSVLSMEQKPDPGQPKPMWEIAWWIPWLAAALLVAIVVALALVKRTRTQLAAAEHSRDRATEQTRALHDEMIRTEERTRIARDMHDTLAAGLSRISLFAGALQVGGADNPEKIANTASMIRSTAHDALDELKHIVGVLRGSAGAARPSGHQGIDAVPDLVHSARAAGLHTTVFLDLHPGDVGTVSGHVTYRVVQEALTNAQKYAHDQTVRITVTGAEHDGLRIEIRNRLSTSPPAVPTGSRAGLTGLTEQAHQIGGTVHAGVDGADFVVSCWLPWFA
ncbi:histidine kinase [Rhodococcus ruber]|uniref:sensor histidine kinase n=1 Tax=Rhodococcus TaxID=1827 RepID=UPI0005912418|nr:histidine kinase [Rhodococcus ruber]MCD2129201.1 two-component sensor histidine kinase [Rhodococcus ruber]MCZ4505765.1 histidine kinase [Rhodococcus ruber]MCZ4532904.1 histidine kinase [Rhodococcus ruber]MCZ4623361.1 histidine kinase [Rhodococcus ruber]MDI9984751.1 histidine kinase [Rhodococcus ruber]